ncbi:P-loop NTPase family protein [Nonomuraea angiospora]|uniref:FtsK/SpoIIIE domain-containing protein n=1 Tax=Nonomuraea angiospora TaxID=46172 RepID=UPI0029B3BF8F|nr:FtsK/SpoIIIE domain-containing protein [Nonomuraea angiospora]MDX3099686.1 FtsK/SpoIIIE domain-containing protein [Nonomuraea angiospora]
MMATDTFTRPQTSPDFWRKPSRTRQVLHTLKQGKYGRRSIRFVYRASTAPVAGASTLATTAWRWVRADDYAGTDDHVFRESVRTRRRRTAWMLGFGYLAGTAAATAWWDTSAPVLAAGAVVGVGTVVEVGKRIASRPVPFKLPGRKGGTPQENQVVRAAIDAKLGRAEGMRLASPVLTEEGGWSTVLQLPPGQRARACLGKEADFASALGVGETQVVFELIPEHAGRLAIYVSKADPFLKLYPSPLIERTEPLDFWAGIPAGVNGRGRREVLRLVDACLLVAGEPRAGKSAAVNGIIGAAALAVTPRIHLFDGKGAGDHRPWRRIAHTAVKRNAPALLDHLKRMQAQMERIFDLLDNAGGASKLNPELCRQFGVDVELTIVDEMRYYVTSPQGPEIVSIAADIASRGPAAGVLLVLATQRMTKDALPPELKGVCSLRWAMRCPDVIASNAVLGPGAAGAGYDASEIPRSHRGVGILDADGADPVRLRSYFLDDDGLAAVAAAAATLREAAGVLPPHEQHVDNLAELEAVLSAFGDDDKLLPDELAGRLGWDRDRLTEELAGVPLKQIWRDGGNAGRGYRRDDIAARADR